LEPSSFEVARHYNDFLSGFVLDSQDQNEAARISEMGIIPFVTQTIMRSNEDRIQLAKEVLDFSLKFLKKGA
jgi:hypothetical protein